MKKFLTFLSYVLVAAIASVVTFGAVLINQDQQFQASPKLQQVLQLIEERFIGETDRTVLEDAAASAMIGAMGDRWSYYIPAKDYAAHMEQMKNAYVGIGVTISPLEEGGFEITVVNPGGPAEAAGIQLGDVIVAVSGQSVLEMDTTACRDLVRGEEGTFVDITEK